MERDSNRKLLHIYVTSYYITFSPILPILLQIFLCVMSYSRIKILVKLTMAILEAREATLLLLYMIKSGMVGTITQLSM